MSVDPVRAPERTSAPRPSHEVHRTPATPHDARELAEAFSAAARRGQLPTGGRAVPNGRDAKPLRLGPDGKPLPQPALAGPKPRGDDRLRSALSEVRRDDSTTAQSLLTQPGPGFAAPMQAPQSSTHVDPGAFADMLTQIWMREQGKTAREVRVSFGDAAWPATGATLLRLEDGSLRVTVSVGQGGGDVGDGLAALRDRLNARGLNVADVAVEDQRG